MLGWLVGWGDIVGVLVGVLVGCDDGCCVDCTVGCSVVNIVGDSVGNWLLITMLYVVVAATAILLVIGSNVLVNGMCSVVNCECSVLRKLGGIFVNDRLWSAVISTDCVIEVCMFCVVHAIDKRVPVKAILVHNMFVVVEVRCICCKIAPVLMSAFSTVRCVVMLLVLVVVWSMIRYSTVSTRTTPLTTLLIVSVLVVRLPPLLLSLAPLT